jgi:hypothetical protein
MAQSTNNPGNMEAERTRAVISVGDVSRIFRSKDELYRFLDVEGFNLSSIETSFIYFLKKKIVLLKGNIISHPTERSIYFISVRLLLAGKW